jgi:hypothetical protein
MLGPIVHWLFAAEKSEEELKFSHIYIHGNEESYSEKDLNFKLIHAFSMELVGFMGLI